MKAAELERRALELVDNLNHNVVNQVPSDKQVRHGEKGTQGRGDAGTRRSEDAEMQGRIALGGGKSSHERTRITRMIDDYAKKA